MSKQKKYNLSIIIPVYNEEENMHPLIEKINKSLAELPLKIFEVLFIDDGSTDKTLEMIKSKQKKYKYIKIIKLRRNFGKAAAYSAGFAESKYEILITLDGDLQDDPQEIKKFLEKIDEGYALVTGWKFGGKGTITKTIISRFFNFIVSLSFNINLHDFNCPFKAYRKEAIQGLEIYSGLYRFIPIFAQSYGFKIAEIKIKNLPRIKGKSKYGGKRILTGFFDFLTALFLIRFNLRPMYLFGSLALVNMIIGTIILAYLTVLSFQGQAVGARPLFSLGVLLEIMSLQFFSIGFIAELFTRNLIATNSKYFIEKIII